MGYDRDKVLRVLRACLKPKWASSLNNIVGRVEVGLGLHMGLGSWRQIGVGNDELQPLVVWSFASLEVVHLVKAKGWLFILVFMWA